MKTPTRHQIAAARAVAGLTMEDAASLVHAHKNTWNKWERGDQKMHSAYWELFLIKFLLHRTPPGEDFRKSFLSLTRLVKETATLREVEIEMETLESEAEDAWIRSLGSTNGDPFNR